jgi:signal-transduction protein with cAMP-binding, CBS, and nucleotidyltransferase domain
LGKKGFVQARSSRQKRYAPGTVMALRPSQPLTVVPQTTVAEASQIMAAKREDCVLVIDEEQRLSGIFTAKDLAFRVVGQGIDSRNILIRDIMTENPICARQSSPATEALEIMVRRGFRHMVKRSRFTLLIAACIGRRWRYPRNSRHHEMLLRSNGESTHLT